jgi:hypothetical protein
MFWLFDYDFFGDFTLQSDEQPDHRAELFTLVTRSKVKPHQWIGGKMIPKSETLSGHEQREWHCASHCGLVRITVIPEGVEARREYRWGAEDQFCPPGEPECAVMVEIAEAKAS